MIKGIDVYNGTGIVEWEKVKKARYSFVMIKSSEGYTLADKSMHRNLTGAAAVGLHVGVYHWLHAVSISEATKEATFFLNTIKGYNLEYPVALDIEQNTILQLSKQLLTDIVIHWCNQIKQAGYYVVIYANLNVLRNHLDWSRINKYDLWLAQYNSTMSNSFPVSMWQYSETGKVPGVKNGIGNVDLNISYKNYPSIISQGGFNGLLPLQNISGLTLDTFSKDLMFGSKYTVLARCQDKPKIIIVGQDIIEVSEPYIDSKGRGWLIDVIGIYAGSEIKHGHITVQSRGLTKQCNFNVKRG